MKDLVDKTLHLTARDKPELVHNITGYANYDLSPWEKPDYINEDQDDWWIEEVDDKWDLELWKPIRCEEKLEVNHLSFTKSSQKKVHYKHKFWLKKIMIKHFNRPKNPEAWDMYEAFAICYDKSKNGEYTIIGQQLKGGIFWDNKLAIDDEFLNLSYSKGKYITIIEQHTCLSFE
jgi:hypothetical protein